MTSISQFQYRLTQFFVHGVHLVTSKTGQIASGIKQIKYLLLQKNLHSPSCRGLHLAVESIFFLNITHLACGIFNL